MVQGTVRPPVRSALRDGPAWSRVVASEETTHGLSRPESAFRSLPVRPRCIRASDSKPTLTRGKTKRGQTGISLGNFLLYAYRRKFPKGLSRLSPEPEANPTTHPNGHTHPASHCDCGAELFNAVQRQSAAPAGPATSTKKRHHHDTPATPSQQPTTPEPTPKQSSRPRTADSPQPFSVTVEA